MPYTDVFVASVPDSKRDDYLAHVTRTAEFFKQHGALRIVELWGEDVPDGSRTDFRRAVAAEPGETVVTGWIEWPDKATRDASQKAFMEDERLEQVRDMPFDGKRMIFGGFVPVVDMGGKQ